MLPEHKQADYRSGWIDGSEDRATGADDRQWNLLGTEFYRAVQDDWYWRGYGDGFVDYNRPGQFPNGGWLIEVVK